MRYAKNLFTVALIMFFISGMAGLSLAAPPGSQPPSSGNTVPLSLPDLRMIRVDTYNMTKPGAPPSAGDEVRIYCEFFLCGCVQQKSFWSRVDIDGTLLYEQEGGWVPPRNWPPCSSEVGCNSNEVHAGIWTATPGSHTIKCILDSKNEITEGLQNELNNTKSITVNVPLPKSAIDKIKDIKTKQPIPVPVPGVR